MIEVEVGPSPVDLGDALGVPETGRTATLWRIQNRGVAAVYRSRAATSPDRAAVRGFRHASGTTINVPIYAADTPGKGRTWVWTDAGDAVLVCEAVDPGV